MSEVLQSIHGDPVPVPDPDHLVHLQFRRFAGCPVCNLHLRSFVQQHDRITAAGVREVVFFHSTQADLMEHAGDLPFAVIADPTKHFYRAYGVESAPRSLLSPRAWGPILRALAASTVDVVRGRKPAPSLNPAGGRFGLPADFLLDTDGRIVASKRGSHVYDQWSVDEMVRLAAGHSQAPGGLGGTLTRLRL